MFYDEVLKRMTKPGTKMIKIVTEKRDKVYTKKQRNMETGEVEEVFVSKGWEIAKTLNTTDEGARQWKLAHPETPPTETPSE